jgi:AAA15 family ATPase/GTPase
MRTRWRWRRRDRPDRGFLIIRMNSIKNIEIKNFKSILHVNINDCRRINVFIGYPNVGKSNILEALSIFSIDDSNYDFSSFVRVKNLTTLFYNGEINKQAEIRINDKQRFVVRFENDALTFLNQFERVGTSFAKEDTRNIYLDDSNDVSVKKSFQLTANNKSVINYKSSSIGKENELYEIRKYDFLKRIQYLSKGYSTLSYPYGENIFNIISTNESLRKGIEDLFKPYNLELLYDSREQSFTILKRTSGGIFTIPYELLADTLQRVIFYKSAIRSNKETALLLEEPESHMFPPYMRIFTTDVLLDKRNQFFLTTHSPYILESFMEEAEDDLAIFLVYYEGDATNIRRMNRKDMDEVKEYGVDLFYNLESYLKHGQVNNA